MIFLQEEGLLEDRIRELCAKAVAMQDAESVSIVLAELRASLREHQLRLEAIMSEFIGLDARGTKKAASNGD
jgi:chromosome segregation and condensation protein ScpB